MMAFVVLSPSIAWSPAIEPLTKLTSAVTVAGWISAMDGSAAYFSVFAVSSAWVLLMIGLSSWATVMLSRGEVRR
jgi:hypothetical protein